MHLIASPLQKQFYTYLPKSPIYKRYSIADLPISYHNLVNRQNGGYTSKSYIPTDKPTRDAMNAVFIPYIAGMFEQKTTSDYHIPSITRQDDFINRSNVPDSAIIFYEDQDRVAYMDFANTVVDKEPTVAYMDIATGQTLTLAPTFEHFLKQFENRYLGSPAPTLVTAHRVNSAILKESSFEKMQDLIEQYEQILGKQWHDDWQNLIDKYADKPFQYFKQAVKNYSQQQSMG